MTPPGNTYARAHRPHSTPEGEDGYYRLPLPNRKNNELFAIADQLLGGSRIHVVCEDKKSRMARIPGKMKRKARVRTGDLLIIKPWDIQNEKADIVFRYSRTQASSLSRRKMLPEEINVF
ncbi:MAG TPA: translation initiation factor eIF-1A [Candidatus Thermoplasmatota archaeon]|nr:translation initiation factor eIF-1A [Candidatus Thermoplasmatota archaeon]